MLSTSEVWWGRVPPDSVILTDAGTFTYIDMKDDVSMYVKCGCGAKITINLDTITSINGQTPPYRELTIVQSSSGHTGIIIDVTTEGRRYAIRWLPLPKAERLDMTPRCAWWEHHEITAIGHLEEFIQ